VDDQDRLDLVNKIISEALADAVARGDLPGVDQCTHDASDRITYLVGRRGAAGWTITVEVDFI
jgi:hypothetical protein